MLTDTASSGGSASFLVGIYHRLFGTASHPSIVRYNDFSDVAGYLLQKELHTSVAGVRGGQNQSPVEVRGFLLEVLKYSDNQMNKVKPLWAWLGVLWVRKLCGSLHVSVQCVFVCVYVCGCDLFMKCYNVLSIFFWIICA